jgi:probable aminopeptidase NPEPL1
MYCTDPELESQAATVGRLSGDLIHPLPYCPEFFRKEFHSLVADMKNSVKDRGNAQSACAGQFIGNHLDKYTGRWLHIDMAGPSKVNGRATGYGVGLLLGLAGLL